MCRKRIGLYPSNPVCSNVFLHAFSVTPCEHVYSRVIESGTFFLLLMM